MLIDKLKLLAGEPIKFYDIGYIHPFTIGDIKNIGGEEQFNIYLNVLTMNKDMLKVPQDEENDVDNDKQFEELNDITNLDLICLLNMSDSYFHSTYIKAMNFIFKEEVNLTEYGIYIGKLEEGKLIDSKKYDELIEIIKIQNCLQKQDNIDEMNPSSDKARELLKKRKKLREKVNQLKNKDGENDGEPLTIDDLVSILCANGNGINVFNVWDLSFYTFNDQFNRMKMFEDFQINVHSLLAGADPNEIELKHWMSKIG